MENGAGVQECPGPCHAGWHPPARHFAAISRSPTVDALGQNAYPGRGIVAEELDSMVDKCLRPRVPIPIEVLPPGLEDDVGTTQRHMPATTSLRRNCLSGAVGCRYSSLQGGKPAVEPLEAFRVLCRSSIQRESILRAPRHNVAMYPVPRPQGGASEIDSSTLDGTMDGLLLNQQRQASVFELC